MNKTPPQVKNSITARKDTAHRIKHVQSFQVQFTITVSKQKENHMHQLTENTLKHAI